MRVKLRRSFLFLRDKSNIVLDFFYKCLGIEFGKEAFSAFLHTHLSVIEATEHLGRVIENPLSDKEMASSVGVTASGLSKEL